MPRFSAHLAYLFTERPFLERFGAAAAAGFKAVEQQFPYDVPPAALAAELKKHDLTQLAINTPLSPEFGLAAQPGREREFEADFKRALDYVTTIGGTGIHCMAGVVPVHARPAAEKAYIANLTRAAPEAARHNITLLIEPINPRDRPDYYLRHLEHAADIVAKVGAPNLRIQFDFYHLQIMGGDLLARFEKFLPLIGHVQVAAVPLRNEPETGEVNFPFIFEEIDRLGYKGWIGCEYKPSGRTEDGLGWAKPYGIGQ